MCISAVTLGISERLASLKEIHVYGKEEEDDRNAAQSITTRNAGEKKKKNNAHNAKLSKLIGGDNNRLKLKSTLTQIWGGKESSKMKKGGKMFKMAGQRDSSSITWQNFSLRKLSILLKEKVVDTAWYKHLISTMIFIAAIVQIVNSTVGDNEATETFHLFFQAFFLLECMLVFFTHYDNFFDYFREPWNVFDLVITLLLFVPTSSPQVKDYQFVEALRIFRLSRCIIAISAVSIDLKIVLSAISSSALSLVYVFVIVLIFFFYSALVAVLMFRSADPDSFGSFGTALQILLQVMTLDNW